MLAQIGLAEVARALLVPWVFLATCSVLLMLALLTSLLILLGIRAWNIHHDIAATSFNGERTAT